MKKRHNRGAGRPLRRPCPRNHADQFEITEKRKAPRAKTRTKARRSQRRQGDFVLTNRDL